MDLPSKLFDKIVSIVGGTTFVFSFVLGTLVVVFFQNEFEMICKKLPFENTSNIAVGFVFVVCCIYLFLYVVLIWFPRLIKKIQRAFVYNIHWMVDEKAEMHSLMCYFDSVSDTDHDNVVAILDNYNKIPYVTNQPRIGFDINSPFSILCPIQLFDVHSIRVENSNSHTFRYSYTLKPDMYLKLLHIYQKHKRLSNIERPLLTDSHTREE